MPFTGAPVIEQVADDLVRVTGVQLLATAAGTIGMFPRVVAPDIRLPEGFKPNTYADVTMQASVKVDVERESGVSPTPLVVIAKTGTDPSDFTITLTNQEIAEGESSGLLEIYVRFH